MIPRPSSAVGCLTAVTVLTATVPASVAAQLDEAPEPAAYALENVTVVRGDGGRAEGVTLVVRGPLVETLAAGAPIPGDARLLDGDSLIVYPGLVDAFGDAEMELPEAPDRQEVVAWAPERRAQGFTPHLRAADHLTVTGGGLARSRRDGVVAAGVFPRDGLAAGRGAALIFRKDAEVPRELVVEPEVGLYMSFQGARGAYPSTLFGVIAFIRQAYADADRMAEVASAYRTDPAGLTLPAWDEDHRVLRRTVEGGLRVFFHADGAEDIRRVLGLADELGFSPVLVGGGEAWKVADELARRRVPVVVSLDFPEPDAWDPEAEAGADLEPAAAREKERLENLYANAGRLVDAGVQISLTSEGGRADLREGARRAIEHGLSREVALQALTSTPARLLGMPALGRIEEGLSATFIVADGPLFDEETGIRYTFVEGRLEEADAGDASIGDEPPAVDVTGTWAVEMTVEGQAMQFEMTLEQEGASFTGSMRGGQIGEARVTDGVVSGTDVGFNIIVSAGPETLELQATGTVEGDTMRGRSPGGGSIGSFDFTATRRPGAGAGGAR